MYSVPFLTPNMELFAKTVRLNRLLNNLKSFCFTEKSKATQDSFIEMITVVTEAVVQRCSVKKVFLKNSQNSKEKPVPESLFK